jgi:hypothetical protein
MRLIFIFVIIIIFFFLLLHLLLPKYTGGASSGFVGTDTAYLGGDGNFLRPVVGVEATDSIALGITKAGSSTALGFAAVQTLENVTATRGTNWTD